MITTIKYQDGEKIHILCEEYYQFKMQKKLCARMVDGSQSYIVLVNNT